MKKKLMRALFILCCLQLFYFLWIRIEENKSVLQVENALGKNSFLFHVSHLSYQDKKNISISSYYDEESGEYFLFLPHFLEGIKSRLLLYGADSMAVDQQIYQNKDDIQFLTKGRHTVAINGEFYVLNIMFGSKIPVLFLDIESGNMDYLHESKENTEAGNMNYYDRDGKLQNSYGLLDIHGRGNASWIYQLKRGYSIKLSQNTMLAGDRPTDRYNLVGSKIDPTPLENKMIYELGDRVGLAFSPEAEMIDLYISGEYRGLYMITNKVDITEESVQIRNLEKETETLNNLRLEDYAPFWVKENGSEQKGVLVPVNPDDITGGYLLEQDHAERYEAEPSGFITKGGSNIAIKSPVYASQEQVEYISKFVQEFETAMMDPEGIHPDTEKHYSEYIDMDSFVKMYLIQEITKNQDMNLTSQFFYKPQGENSVLYAGPIWDMDMTCGIVDQIYNGTNLADPEGLLAEHNYSKEYSQGYFPHLYRQKDFYDLVVQIYHEEVRDEVIHLIETIDAEALEVYDSAQMNQIKFYVEGEYMESIQTIKLFLSKRLEYMDKVWGKGDE